MSVLQQSNLFSRFLLLIRSNTEKILPVKFRMSKLLNQALRFLQFYPAIILVFKMKNHLKESSAFPNDLANKENLCFKNSYLWSAVVGNCCECSQYDWNKNIFKNIPTAKNWPHHKFVFKISSLGTEAYSEPCQTFKMEFFAKWLTAEAIIYFCKKINLWSLTEFWMSLGQHLEQCIQDLFIETKDQFGEIYPYFNRVLCLLKV